MKSTFVKCIGNGQVTIPKTWRNLLKLENGPIKATLKGSTIILEPFSNEIEEWQIEKVQLNNLSSPVKRIIADGRNKYLSGNTQYFHSSIDILNQL